MFKTISLSGYDILEQLGKGSQGRVFLARRESDDLPVAIKQLNIHSVKSWKAYDLFHREADILAKLNIDGVARFYAAFDRLEDDPPCSYIVQEYIPGRSLGEMLSNGHRFKTKQVYDILMQLIDILEQLHAHNVIHRDIKPSNIMLVPLDNGSVKVYLIDFGAVANPQVQGGGSTMAGTFGYMPPEQLMGKPEPASDIYALAAVAVTMMTGKSPTDLPTKDYRIIFEPEMQNQPVAVVNTLRQMLDPDPAKRLCDYQTLHTAFESYQNNIYKDIHTCSGNLSPKAFEENLKRVSSYGDSGNIELWQNLDDVLPRKEEMLPTSYLELKNRQNQHYTDGRPIFKYTSFVKPKVVEHKILSIILKTMILLLIALPPIIIFFGSLMSSWLYSIFDEYAALVLILYIITTIVVITVAFNFTLKKDFFKTEKRVKVNLKFKSKCDSLYPIIHKLLLEGRKTIATICEIEYDTCSNICIEQHTIDEKRHGIHSSTIARYAYHACPLFKISYQFNPPDDEKKEDLIHHIYTSIAPEGLLKVGDPFPILYRIYKDENRREHVDSMPFPIPLDDVSDMKHIVYHRTPQQLEADERSKNEDRQRNQAEWEKYIQKKNAEQQAKTRENECGQRGSSKGAKQKAYNDILQREKSKNQSYAKYSDKVSNTRTYKRH